MELVFGSFRVNLIVKFFRYVIPTQGLIKLITNLLSKLFSKEISDISYKDE